MSDVLHRITAGLDDRYEIEGELGEGGMATVYRARDRKHDRLVAIKVLRPELGAAIGAERFLREIAISAKLEHPHILTLIDSGEVDGLLYYVMPLVEGESLRDKINRERQLGLDEVMKIGSAVASALDYAHRHDVIHRDIKPENILLHDGEAVVADFGIAVAVSEAGGERLTGTGLSVGTPHYMSPEQATADRALDTRSDIYSVGCVMYEMLTGDPPHTGANIQALTAKIVTDVPISPRRIRSAVPEHVDAAIMKALAKTPADRFATARELVDALTGAAATRPSVVTALTDRRVLRNLAFYAVAAAGVWGLTKWLAGLLTLSPYLPGFVLVSVLLLAPVVALLTSRQLAEAVGGRKAAGVFANAVVAAAVLVLLFNGKDLGAATVAVTVTDEDGEIVERVIPKAAFREHIALFFFEAETDDSAAQALQFGVPIALIYDLYQDLFFDLRSPAHFREDLRRAGYPDLTSVPLSLKRQIAEEQHRDYFITGTVAMHGDEYEIVMSLYDTDRGKLIQETTVRGMDLFPLIDDLTVAIKGTLDIPEGYTDDVVDLPVSELLSESMAAFTDFTAAQRALVVDDDFQAAIGHLESAVREDPTFALAQHILGTLYLAANRPQEGLAPLQAAMDHLYRLPERARFVAKADYYFMRQEAGKAWAVVEMWAELFPEDVDALQALARVQMVRDEKREAIATLTRLLEVDPGQEEQLRVVGGFHEELGEFEDALEYYQRYADLNPEDHSAFLSIGDLHRRMGAFEDARAAYQKALLLETDDIDTLVRLASLDRSVGSFSAALQGIQRALETARTAQDSVTALGGLAAYYEFRGQMVRALEYRERFFEIAATFAPPFMITAQQLGSLDHYVRAGDTAIAEAKLAEAIAALQPPMNFLIPLGELAYYLEIEDIVRAEQAIAGVEQMIEQFSFEAWRPAAVRAHARVHELREEYSQAIEQYEEQARLRPAEMSINRDLGRVHRLMGDLDAAEELLQGRLKTVPAGPRTHYQLALVYIDMDKPEDARRHLEQALTTWSEADEAYEPARLAREKLKELGRK